MDALTLQDTISRALGRAATIAGTWFDAYRPSGVTNPLASQNRFLRLNALLTPDSGNLKAPVGYGHATWSGIFDTAYTQPGDYLVSHAATWFIAAQQKLLPVLAVKTTRTVSFARAAAPLAPGLNTYGGLTTATAMPLTGLWPASVLAAGGNAQDAGLPADGSPGIWTVLLPVIGAVVLRNGDLFTDDLARSGVVSSAELTDLGWRLTVKQATT